MKIIAFSFLLLFLACSPRTGSKITSKQAPLGDSAYVLVLRLNDEFVNDGILIGSIKSGDNGLSTNCTYYEVLNSLKQMARQSGANLIKITDRKFPDKWSTCDRIEANIYRVPDYRKHEIDINWRKDRPLTWDDFKGDAPTGYHRFAAVTAADIEVESNAVNLFTKAKFFTTAVFRCHSSWVKGTAKAHESLLKHEQLHFDLVEVYRRMLQKKLNETSYNSFNLDAAKLVTSEYFNLYTKRAAQYDAETHHGALKDEQEEWDIKVAAELSGLKDYENTIQ